MNLNSKTEGPWPKEIAGHVIDHEVDVRVGEDTAVEKRFYCVECGETFEERPARETLERLPCDPRPSDADRST